MIAPATVILLHSKFYPSNMVMRRHEPRLMLLACAEVYMYSKLIPIHYGKLWRHEKTCDCCCCLMFVIVPATVIMPAPKIYPFSMVMRRLLRDFAVIRNWYKCLCGCWCFLRRHQKSCNWYWCSMLLWCRFFALSPLLTLNLEPEKGYARYDKQSIT